MFRSKLSLAAGLALLASPPLNAAETRDFNRDAFIAAQAASRPIIVEVRAWWCPVCASQGRTIKDEVKDPAYANLVVFKLNYDRQKVELPAFAVRKQGTILAYRGRQPVGRLDFVTDKPRIRALIAQTVR